LVFFFSSSLSLKDTRTDRQKEKRKSRDTTTQPRARDDRQLQKNSGRKAVSLSPPLKNYSHRLRAERERERQRERQRESKKESAKNLFVVERNVFFFLCEKKKSASLISSHLISVGKITRVAANSKETEEERRRRRWWWRRW